MTDESGGTDERLLEEHTTGEDRVRMVARQLVEPRTANWVATEAGWSHEPTKRVLERMVDDGVLRRDDDGGHTTYCPDRRHRVLREAVRLRDDAASVEELTETLAEMKSQIREWESEYGVESPNQLRATVGDADIDSDEETRRREIAREWERLEGRIRVVSFAIREWDFLRPGGEPAAADG